MKIDESIIDKVLDDKASAEDAKEVSEWFATDEGQDYLSHRLDREAQNVDDKTVEEWVPYDVPEGDMKQRLMEGLSPKRQLNRSRRWLAVAVLIPFIFLSVSTWFLADKVGLFTETEYAELAVPCGEQMHVVLQDGTVIHLNSDTRLKYPKKFGIFDRKVELWGEAYFEVAKEKDRPFIIDLKGLDVKVTGTKFNVKAYLAETNVWVTLDEGGVILKGFEGKEYALHPGESAEYDRESGACQISRPEDMGKISSWRSNSLNFYLTPLKEIVQVLSRQYDVHFIVSDSTLLEHRFTLSTSKVNVGDVLHDLEEVSHIAFRPCEDGSFEIIDK